MAAALVALALGIGATLVLSGDDLRPVDAINSACAAVATRLHGPVADFPNASNEVVRVARESAADVRALHLPSASRAPELTEALTAYADTQAGAGGDALIDPVAIAAGLDEARRRLDRVAAGAQAPSCASAALAPDRRAPLP